MNIRKASSRFFYSFPVQLVIMHFKKNQMMMLYWLLLFGFITETIAKRFGIPFLFLDPEYMGHVGGRSFFIMGLSLGAFIMAFNISSFILNSFRFPFLATLSRTFVKYAHNNCIIPGSFLLLYCWRIYEFQSFKQLKTTGEVIFDIAIFLAGVAIVIIATLRYFMVTNKDIYKLFGIAHSDSETGPAGKPLTGGVQRKNSWRVDTYIIFPAKLKIVRDTRHYKRYMLERVFRQNHINAAVIELVVFTTFIMLGLFRDYAYFRIPAGASVILLFTMVIMLSGVFRYWLRAWANTALIGLFIFLNFLSQFELFNPRNKAYGIDYTSTRTPYNRETLRDQCTPLTLEADKANTLAILEKWKAREQGSGTEKPKLVVLNVSGGGLRSCVFTFRTLQVLDSVYHGELLHHTAFATGSSGGMIGLCYYRELFLHYHDSLRIANENINNRFLQNMGKDMLNSMAFSATVADIFLNNQQFKDGEYFYVKDRAWAWEGQLNENTKNILNTRLKDYELPEKKAEVPIVVISPTIINDGRALHIAAQPVSYLLHDAPQSEDDIQAVSNGVEYQRFFKDHNPGNLKLTSALRMNSAFPYVMPAVSLPSSPTIEVMDAGIRDNYGVMNSIQFLHTFRDWIAENTSGVVFLQIRDTYKHLKVEDNSVKTLIEKLTAPMRNLSGNFIIMQDYNFDRYLQYAQSWLKVPMNVVIFQMPETEDRVSLSWHLTEKEKNFLKQAALNPENRRSLEELLRVLPPVNTPPVLAGPLQNASSGGNSTLKH
ncbi:MAG: patatin-like phospholipase family protein [Bacteroidia bacterium]